MSPSDLREMIVAELELMEETICVIEQSLKVMSSGEPAPLEKAGLGALLMNFYMGIENILKRIAQHEQLPMPTGPRWHADLFNLFLRALPSGAPSLFDESIAGLLREYRNFRHVVMHGYGIMLDWPEMGNCIRKSRQAFVEFRAAVAKYLERIEG